MQSLTLQANALQDLLADFLANAPQLQSLTLQANALQDLPADFLADAPQLQSLTLQAEILQDLPADFLVNAPQLQSLTLQAETLQGLPADFLVNAPQLQSLTLDAWPLRVLPAGFLADVPQLQALTLKTSNLTALPAGFLADAPQLQSLVWHTGSTLPAGSIPQLQSLTLDMRQLRALPMGFLDAAPQLQSLTLKTPRLTALPADFLAAVPQLQTLRWEAYALRALPAGFLAAAPQLQSLTLDAQNLWALPAGFLAVAPQLRTLAWATPNLTALPAGLLAHTPQLQTLRWEADALLSLPAGFLAATPQLQSLTLDAWQLRALPAGFLAAAPQLQALTLQVHSLQDLPAGFLADAPQLQSLTLETDTLQDLPAGFLADAPQLQALTLERMPSLTALPAGFLADAPQLQALTFETSNLTAWPEGLLTEGHARLQRVTLELDPQAQLPLHLLAHMPRLAQVRLRGTLRALPAGFLAHTPSLRTLALPAALETIGAGTLAGTGLVDFVASKGSGPLTLGAGFLADAAHLRTFILTGAGDDVLHLPPAFLADLPHLTAVTLDASLAPPLPPGFLRGAQLQALQLYLWLPATAAALMAQPALVQAQHLTLDLACDMAYPSALFRDWAGQGTLTLRPCPAGTVHASQADPAALAAFLQTVPASSGLHLNWYSDLPRTAYAHLPMRTLALGVDTDAFTGWVPAAAPQPGATVAVRAGPGWEHPVVGWRSTGTGPPAVILERVQAQGEWWRIPHDFLAGLPLQSLHLFPAGAQADLSRATLSRGRMGHPRLPPLHTNPHLRHLTLEEWGGDQLVPPGTSLRLDWLQIIGGDALRLRPDFLRPHRVPILFLDWNSGWFSDQSSDVWLRTLVAAWPPALRHLVLHTHLGVLDGPVSADRTHPGRSRDGRGLAALIRALPAGVDCLHLVLPGMARPLPDALRTAAVLHGLSLQVQAAASPALPDRILPAAAMRSFFETAHRPWTQARTCARSLLVIDPLSVHLRISGVRPSMGDFRAPDWTLPADLLDQPGSLRHVRIDFDPQRCPDCRAH